MQIKKMARKIAAIGTGALMLGATLTGALAVSDLADYPSPFVADGVLDNTVIVVGGDAQTADVLGAVDIAAGLQAAAVSQQEIEGTTSVAPSVTEGVKIEKAGNVFNYNEDIDTVLESTSLDDGDLPDMLSDGSFVDTKGDTDNDEDFEQTLTFTAGTGTFNLYQDDDLAPEGGNYLHLADGELYTYTLEFDQAIEYATASADADFEGVTFEIQGRLYTITDVGLDSSDEIDEMTLLAGDSVIWLVQDQPYTVGSHTVTVVDVDQGETKCGVNVDGVTRWIDDGSTEEVGDLSIGILDVIAVYTKDYDADTCELSLGSSEIVLKEGDAISVNNADIEGSEVTFSNSAAGEWMGFSITFDVGDEDEGINSDEIYLATGDAWTDPVFGNFKILFEGVTADYEEMSFSASSEDATFSFKNVEGDDVDIPFFYDDVNTNAIRAGTDEEAYLLQPGQEIGDVNGGSAQDPEGTLLWYVTSGGEARVLELKNVEGLTGSNANTTTIEDWMTGKVLAEREEFTPGITDVITLGSLGSIELNLTAGSSGDVKYTTTYGNNNAETLNEGLISFNSSRVTLTEVEGDETAEATIDMELSWDSTDEELQILNPAGTNRSVDFSEDNDDDQIFGTDRGTLIEIDTDNRDSLTVMYPAEDAYANVFVAPLSATVVAGGTGTLTADKVNPFTVGLAVLDSDASGMSKNMVVVGGPCVNTVAASLMGNPESCAEGFEPGKAMLKYFDRNGKAALLVAGYEAQDTLGASYVLADYEDYDLSGDEVEVVVTSLDQITVSTV